jgi:hypothetical protein
LFSIKKNNDTEGLKKAIDDALLELAMTKPNTEDYDKILDKIERLSKLKAPAKEARKPVSPDALIAAAASLAGIVLVINQEHVGAVTSKAFGLVVKPKL